MQAARKLYRARDGYIGGVCAGVAERLGIDAVLVRVLAVLIAVTTLGVGALAYVVMWISLPLKAATPVPFDVVPEHVESQAYGDVDADAVRGRTFGQLSAFSQEEGMNTPMRAAVAVGLLLLFAVLARAITPFVKGTYWWQYWPLGLIITGFALIVVPIARERTTFWHLGGVVLVILGWAATPMSVGLLSPLTFVHAMHDFWWLLIAAFVLFIVAAHFDVPAVAVLAVALFGAFFVMALTNYVVPGSLSDLVIVFPDGSSRLMLRMPQL